MCDVCRDAADEIKQFAAELVEKYPATEIHGKPVSRVHHVAVGLLVTAERYLQQEAMDNALLRGAKVSSLLGGNTPIAEA